MAYQPDEVTLVTLSRLLLVTTLIFTCLNAEAANFTNPSGFWLAYSPFYSNRPVGVVKLYLVNNKILCGQLVKVFPLNGNFKTRSNAASSGPVMMCDYHYQNGKWIDGKIYEQSSAMIYTSSIELSHDNKTLHVTGHSGPLSKTSVWKRLK